MLKAPSERKQRILLYAFLQAAVLIYSLSMLAAKAAGRADFLSLPFVLYYGAMLLCLGLYALAWQPLLKKLPLTVAFCCKSVSVVWGLIGGAALFGESLTPQKLIGAGLVMVGIVLVVSGKEAGKAA